MIIDKPDIVYVMENQSVTITVTLNHVNATVIWKRYLQLCHVSFSCVIYFMLRKGITELSFMYKT